MDPSKSTAVTASHQAMDDHHKRALEFMDQAWIRQQSAVKRIQELDDRCKQFQRKLEAFKTENSSS